MNIVKMAPIKRKNPKTGKVAWYLQKRKYDTISSKELVEAMARNTGIPVAKVAMATDAIVKQLKNFLLNGHSVNIIGLGTFSPRIKSRPSDSKDAVTADNVKALLLKFRPQTDIREDMKNTVGYEVIHSDITGTAPAPVPEDPYQGVTKFFEFNDGELNETEIERTEETAKPYITLSSTFFGLKTDGSVSGGKFVLAFTGTSGFPSNYDPKYTVVLKPATGSYKSKFDYVVNGVDVSGWEEDTHAKNCYLLYLPSGVKLTDRTDNFKYASMIDFIVMK